MASAVAYGQKIMLGSCVLKDGGMYKGEMVAGVISKSIMAFDAVMVVSKLYRRYGKFFKKKRR